MTLRLAVLITSVTLGVTLLATGAADAPACSDSMVPSPDLRRDVVQQIIAGKPTIDVQFLVEPACLDPVQQTLTAAGARMDFADRKVAYLLASAIPTASAWQVLTSKGIVDAALATIIRPKDEVVPRNTSTSYGPVTASIPVPQVSQNAVGHVPFFPAEEAGLSDLWRWHPNADGRGATIGLVDDGIDLLHPAFGPVRDEEGRRVPKVSDVDPMAPVGEGPDWVRLARAEKIDPETVTFNSQTWRIPRDADDQLWGGTYEKNLGLGIASQKTFTHLSLRAGVLWSPVSGRVWVDTQGSRNFQDAEPLHEYRLHGEVGYFGQKAGDRDDRIPFTIHIATDDHAVNIHVPRAYHGTTVASTAAANRTSGGLFDGAAPNAKLVSVQDDWSTSLASVLRALARDDVDVVNRSGGVSGTSPAERAFSARVIARAVAIYDKPLLCLECAQDSIFDVMDYQSARMLRENRQIAGYVDASVNSYLAFDEAGFVNRVLAPSVSLQAESRYSLLMQGELRSDLAPAASAQNPAAPVGYSVGANMSPTISLASGLIADLVSLARQERVPYNVPRLRDAVFTSAELVAGWPASVQGHGVINVSKAWDHLVALHRFEDRPGAPLTTFVTKSRREGRLSVVGGWREEFERNDAAPVTRSLFVTRKSEGNDGRHYALRLRGDMQPFRLASDHVDLRTNVQAELRFSIVPMPGRHLAFLQLINTTANIPVFEIPLMSTSPSDPDRYIDGVAVFSPAIPPNRYQDHSIAVPRQTELLHVAITMPRAPSNIRVASLVDARVQNVALGASASARSASDDAAPRQELEAWRTEPPAGIWIARLSNRGVREYDGPSEPPAPTTSVQGEVRLESYHVELRQRGDSLAASNAFTAVEGAVEFIRTSTKTPALEWDESRRVASMSLPVAAGVDAVRVRATVPGQSGEIEVVALRCRAGNCQVADEGHVVRGASDLWLRRPEAGDWRIALLAIGEHDVARLRDAIVRVDVIDGTSAVVVATPNARHASGEQWNTPIPDAVRRGAERGQWYAGFRMGKDVDSRGRMLGVVEIR